MKNKLVFRILGALASALIIVSVFVPFVSVTGYSVNLWKTFESDLYLPIMIIAFGAIGVIFFSLNVKTEFAYMSTGAITFFLVIRTIDVLNQDAFSTLSIGYYFLVIGTLLTGIMAFLTNLRSKKIKENEVIPEQSNETTMLDQIDKLYNDQTTIENEISPIQPVDTVVQPLPAQPIENIIPVQPIENQQVISQQPIDSVNLQQVIPEPINTENISVQQQAVPQNNIQEQVEIPLQPQPTIENVQLATVNQEAQELSVEHPINPVVSEFSTDKVAQTNPVIEQFATITQNPVVNEFSAQQPINTVVNEFSNPIPEMNSQPIVQPQSMAKPVVNNIPLYNIEEPTAMNPVINSFTNPGSTVAEQQSDGLDIFS